MPTTKRLPRFPCHLGHLTQVDFAGRPSRHLTQVGFVTFWILVSLVLPIAAADFESRAREIDNKLMAPCCGANTVRDHDSASATQVRAEIRRMLAEGKTEQQILDHFVAQYGEKILALPRAKGFNLLAYLLPTAFLLCGGLFLVLALRRWQARPSPQANDTPLPTLDPAYLERLQREVKKES